jgi:hypothetical protein
MLNICVFADHKMGETHIWLVPWDAVLLSLWVVDMLLIFSICDIPLLTERKIVYEAFEGRALCNWPICYVPIHFFTAGQKDMKLTKFWGFVLFWKWWVMEKVRKPNSSKCLVAPTQ